MTVSRSNPLAPGRPRCSWHPPRPDRCAVDGGGTSIPVADFPVRSPAGVRLDPSPGFAPVPARGSKSTARLGGFGGCDWWSGTCFLSPHPRCGCGQAPAALGGMHSLEIRRWRAAGPFTPQCWRPRQICSTTLRVTCCHPCGRRRQRRAGCRGFYSFGEFGPGGPGAARAGARGLEAPGTSRFQPAAPDTRGQSRPGRE